MAIILLVAVLGAAGLTKWSMSLYEEEIDWKGQIQADIESQEANIESEEESIYKYKLAEEKIQIAQYQLEEGIKPIQPGTFWGFMKDSEMLFSFILLFAIIIASGIMASEFSSGTIKLLTIRPVSRGKILWSKYVTTIVMSFSFMVLLIILSALAGILFFPYEGAQSFIVSQGDVVAVSPIVTIAQSYAYSFVSVIIFITIAFMISVIFRSNAMAVGITMFTLFTAPAAIMFFMKYDWVKYILFTHSDFSQYLSGYLTIPENEPVFSIIVIALYVIVFNVITYFTFTKRDIAV